MFTAVMPISYALSANPFLSEQALRQGETPGHGGANAAPGIDSIVRELMSLHPAPSPMPPPVLAPEVQLQTVEWSIVGKINNRVVITNGKKERLIDNGGIIDGCVVLYPEILCGSEKEKSLKNDAENN
jgi:hypothetical protein